MNRFLVNCLISLILCSCIYEGVENELDTATCKSCLLNNNALQICDNEDGSANITMIENGVLCLTNTFNYKQKGLSFEEIAEYNCNYFKTHSYASNCLMCDTFTICDNGDGKTFTYTNFFSNPSYIETFEYSEGLSFKILKAVGCQQ